MATARMVGVPEAATAYLTVIRLVFPDGLTTHAHSSFDVVCIGTGVLVTLVFWMPCIRAEVFFMNFRRRGRRSITP